MKVLSRVLRPQHRQLLGGHVGKGSKQYGIDDTEHGGACANRHGERGRGGCSESRTVAKRPHRVSAIPPPRLEKRETLSITIRLGGLKCAAESESRGPAGVLVRDTAGQIVGVAELEMG